MVVKQEQKKSQNPLKAIISGGLTGGIEICITYPTEYIKTQMQLYPETSKKGIPQIIKQTYQKQGIIGFYKGLSALIVFSVPKTAVRFGTNQYLKNNIFTQKNKLHTFLSGLGAGISEAILVVTPAETLKVKLINDKLSQNPQFKGLIDGIQKIIEQQGWRGCYKGLTPTIIKQGSNQGIRFLVYEDSKQILNKLNLFPDLINMLMAGGFAGFVSVMANTPVDVIKTKMQGLESSFKYKSSIDCFIKTLKNEGMLGLYKGTIPRLTRVVADVAITFTIFDKINLLINYYFPDKQSINKNYYN